MSLFKRKQRISFSQTMWSHPFFMWMTILSSLLILLMVGLAVWKIVPLSVDHPTIPLHYNVFFGVDLVGGWYEVFYLPLLGLIFLVGNAICAKTLWEKEHLLSFFFAGATLIIEVTFFVAVLLITLLNV